MIENLKKENLKETLKNEQLKKENKKLIYISYINKKIENVKKEIEEKENQKKKIDNINKEYEYKLKNINFGKIINDIKKDSYKIFEKYINNVKEIEKKRNLKLNKILNDYKESKKEINEFITSTQISHGIICNKCKKEIKGIRYQCSCSSCTFNLCENCELINYLKKEHIHQKFYLIRKPIQKKIIDTTQ